MTTKGTVVRPPRGHDRKTTDIATISRRGSGGFYVRLYGIRFGSTRTGYARGGAPGTLGPTVAYGGQIEDADGIEVYIGENTDFAEARSSLVAEATRLGIADADNALTLDRIRREAALRDSGDRNGAPV